MVYVRRTLPSASMARERMKLTNDGGGQVLFPGIPDHITMQNIAPKISWETCNVLQMVNRRWQQAIYNRSVYNSKVLSRSTEGFFVLPLEKCMGDDDGPNLVFILYSRKDGSSLLLPPPLPKTKVVSHQYICLDGKVYVWIVPFRKRSEWSPCLIRVEVCVLDLAGDRRWTRRKQLQLPSSPYRTYDYGILDSKIYRFQRFVSCHSVDFNGPACLRHRVHMLPETEVYDPVSDVWSFITPKPLKNVEEASTADLERHLACFSEWTKEQLAVDVSKNLFTNEKYKSYFSEWRRGQQAIHDGMPSVLDDCQHAMAMQIYHKTREWKPNSVYPWFEDLFFCGEKLLRVRTCLLDTYNQGSGVLQMYDSEENAWRNWKSFLIDIPIKPGFSRPCWEISGWAYADNAIWAIAYNEKTYLLRSPMFLNEDTDRSVILSDSLICLENYDGSSRNLRPIYI